MLQPGLGYVITEVTQRQLSSMTNDHIKHGTHHLDYIAYTFVRNSIYMIVCMIHETAHIICK